MAALAPPPYRPSSATHASAGPSSTSATNSATPPKKQGNSDAVAAGRRRLEEFKQRKAAEKSKKASAASAPAAVTSDQADQNASEREPLSVVPTESAGSSVPTSNQILSNGHVPEDSLRNDNRVVSTQNSTFSELASASAIYKEQTGGIPSYSEAQRHTEDLFRKDPPLTALPSNAGAADGNPPDVKEQPNVKTLITSLETVDGEAGAVSGQDRKTTNSTGIPAGPLGASGPIFVPAPPPIRKGIFGSVTSATGYGKSDTAKNPVAVHPSPGSKSSLSSQGLENGFDASSQKASGGNLVMPDGKFAPSNSTREGQFPSSVSEPEPGSTLAKSQLPSAWVSLNERVKPDKQGDGTISTSALSSLSNRIGPISWNVNSENVKRLEYPTVNSSFRTPPSFVVETSSPWHPVPEATASKHLPQPPPVFRPPISAATLKPEPFVPPIFPSITESDASSSTLSSRAPSTSSFLDNALLQPTASSKSQFPEPPSAINAVQENGIPKTVEKSFTAPIPSSSVGEIHTQQINVPAPVEQSRETWPPSSKGNDFSMLEQHIEDLTQEKFSLQRGLDAARALAETLAQENSALTEDFNNQGALVNDLKAYIERLEGEIRAQAIVVKNMKAERDRAVQDSKAAVERSQTLASEVIVLEEKVLRARSQELKLQREMESLTAESESQKRQISSLDKDRANLKSLIEALQEEKGLLQTQIRKAAAAGNSWGPSHPKSSSAAGGSGSHSKADASTSTEDFELETFLYGQATASGLLPASQDVLAHLQPGGFGPLEQQQRAPLIIPSLPTRPLDSPSHAGASAGSFSAEGEGISSQLSQAAVGSLSGRGLRLGPVSTVIPPDQAATIGNINTLITELAEEKQALVKALRAESVGAAELRTLNAELSHKLEVQTQRLELAVAQSMAIDSAPRAGTSIAVSRVAPEYIDEGDEVVDRVLGWIMQLFPTGASRRKRL